MKSGRSFRGLWVGAAFASITNCSWFADLGPEKTLLKTDSEGSGGGAAGEASASTGGDNSGGASSGGGGGVPVPATAYPAVGLLQQRSGEGRSCTGTLVASHVVLTAASCFPAVSRGCSSPGALSGALRFLLPSSGSVRAFPVRVIAPYPKAYPLSAGNECDAICELGDGAPVVQLRRSRDVALVYLDDDADGNAPDDFVEPLRVVTDVGTPATGENSEAARHVYLDLEQDFRTSSPITPLLAGYGTGALTVDGALPQEWVEGRFDLGDFWNVGCEQAPRCGVTENLRNRCPLIPFAATSSFFEDRALRVLDVTQEKWLGSFLEGSTGAPLFVIRGAPSGSLSTFRGDRVSVFGVLSDAEALPDRGGERVAAYVAPTFLNDTGGWLARRLHDFDAGCPVEGGQPESCAPSLAPGWTLTVLDEAISPPAPRPIPWFLQETIAAASWEGRVELFMVGADDVLYRAQGSPNSAPDQLVWGGWRALRTVSDLRSELSAVGVAGSVSVLSLTKRRGLRFFSVTRAGDAIEQTAPASPEGGFTSAPAAVATPPSLTAEPDALDLFIRGGGGELLRYRYRGGEWSTPQTLALSITSAPVAVVAPEGDGIELFVRDQDFRLKRWTIASESSPHWVPQDLGPIEGVLVGAARDADRLDLLARGTHGRLLHRVRLGDEWGAWLVVGDGSRGNLSLISPAPGTLHAYGLSEPDRLARFTYRR